MLTKGGALTRGKIGIACIGLLGLSSGSGVAFAEVQNNSFSGIFSSIGDWLVELFQEDVPPPKTPAPKPEGSFISTIAQMIGGSAKEFFEATSGVYNWLSEQDNQNSVILFIKNLWAYEFLKQLVFNFPWTVRAWLGVLTNKTLLMKFPDAIKRSYILAKFFALLHDKKKRYGNAKMVNWLYLRFLINPRKTLLVLTRGSKGNKNPVESIKCGSHKKPKPNKKKGPALGHCFIDWVGGKSGKKGKGSKGSKGQVLWTLRNEIADFLLKGREKK